MLGFWLTGFMGVFGMCLSLAWICQIALYMLPIKVGHTPHFLCKFQFSNFQTVLDCGPVPPPAQGPISPMLNALFVILDKTWALLGVIFFSIFCLYLMGEGLGGDALQRKWAGGDQPMRGGRAGIDRRPSRCGPCYVLLMIVPPPPPLPALQWLP